MLSILDPSIWAGLLTLIVLEIVLNIDNLVFIAIIVDKLPPKKRDSAIFIGLSLALIMRLTLLIFMSWIVTFNHPIFKLGKFIFSIHDLILLIGGIFLVYKATVELHKRLENSQILNRTTRHNYSVFWLVIIQIVVLDTLFSLDAAITAVGMVNNLPIMVLAVIIAMLIMLVSSKTLTYFINKHPKIVIICLSFLLMIGLSLIIESFGFHISKTYLYASIGFAIIIELLNQITKRNVIKNQHFIDINNKPYKKNHNFIKNKQNIKKESLSQQIYKIKIIIYRYFAPKHYEKKAFFSNNSNMEFLLNLTCDKIMIKRQNIFWIDFNLSQIEINNQILINKYNSVLICYKELDNIVGILQSKDLLINIKNHKKILDLARNSPQIMIPINFSIWQLLNICYLTKKCFFIVTNKQCNIQGIITTTNIIELISNKMNNQNNMPNIIAIHNGWLVDGNIHLNVLQKSINYYFNLDHVELSLSDFIIKYLKRYPKMGDIIDIELLRFKIIMILNNNINCVQIMHKIMY